MMRSGSFAVAAAIFLAAATQPAMAQKKYGPGVTDTEIKLGQTMPYSGPSSVLSLAGKIEAAYFKMINSTQGGVNGRKINLISLDDGFSPPKTVEQTRKLVEGEGVLAIFSSLGSGPNLAIARYLNTAKVPQIMSLAGTAKILDPVNLPWTTSWYPSLTQDGKEFAIYLLESKPDAKIGILYENDETGKSYLDGMKAGLGDKAATMVLKEIGFDLSFPTVDLQILSLQSAGVNTVFLATTAPKFGAQGIRKIGEIGWKPQIILTTSVSTVEGTLKAAGMEHAVGAITLMYAKLPEDKRWEKDPPMMEYHAFMKQWAPGENANEPIALAGYIIADQMVEMLKKCGDDLTRENLLYNATHVKDLQVPLFLPGVMVNISPEDRIPWKQAQMARFDGKEWVFVGGIVTAPSGR